MKVKRNIALSDSGFVFNPSTGDSFSVNPIGLEIIKLLKEEKSEAEIKKALFNKYQTDEGAIDKDFYDFIKMLESNKLLEETNK